MEHKSRAIILKVTDYSEADRLVTFFTEDAGRLKGVAKHAKRSKRRFGGGFELGAIGIVRYNERQGVELVRLDEFQVELPAWKFAASLERISAIQIAIELAEKMLPLAHASKGRFGLLSRWIAFLCDNEPSREHLHAFFYKWLSASGLQPEFEKCVSCGLSVSEAAGGLFIDSAHGGVLCGKCAKVRADSVRIDPALCKYLNDIKNGKVPEGAAAGSDLAFKNLIIHAMGAELRTLSVVESLEGMRGDGLRRI